jgi:hypothetical protein
MCAVAFAAFERLQEEVIVCISHYCSEIHVEELRKTMNMLVRFYYELRDPTIAARIVMYLQNEPEVLLLSQNSRFSY